MVTVLLIEEDAQARAFAERALASPEMKVTSLPNLQSGSEFLRKERPDVVVIGISLSDLHGYDFCRSATGT